MMNCAENLGEGNLAYWGRVRKLFSVLGLLQTKWESKGGRRKVKPNPGRSNFPEEIPLDNNENGTTEMNADSAAVAVRPGGVNLFNFGLKDGQTSFFSQFTQLLLIYT